ncbi:MAG: peptidylprolyl isomerase [bacterium]|nr:MAG: peptidylprolyl isomerase [bacterium]
MPLMHKMRENTHIILFFLLVMFLLSMTIGGLVGGADITHLFGRRPDTIVSINGENISYEQYNDFRQQQIEAYRQQNQKEPQGYELQRLEDEIWESLIREMLIKQFAEKMKIGATKTEIAYLIFENPPEFLRSNPNFLDDNGNFDIKKYQAALSGDPNSPFWTYVQNYLSGTIPFNKIYQEVMTSVFITDEEVKQEFIKRNQKVKVKYVSFSSTDYKIEDSEITQKDIETYYNEHRKDYEEDEKRKIQYVLFEITPTSSDTNEVLYVAETLLDSINQGIDFAYLAENYSDDPGSAKNGGDLDYFERGVMDQQFEEAAFGANVGDVVGPITSQFGIHIIKVEDKKVDDDKEKVRARHILLKVEPSQNTYEIVRDNANYFAEVAQEEGFKQAVISEKVKVDTTDFFTSSGFIPKLGMQKRITDAIFHAKVGKVSRVHYIEDRGYIVYQLIDIQKEQIRPLKDVEQTIKNIVSREKQKELAEKTAQEFREKIRIPEDFERLTEQDSLLNVIETEFFALNGYVRNIGRDANFIGAAFGLEVDEISSVVSETRGAYIIKMVEKQEFDEIAFNSQKESLRNELIQQKQRTAYNNWYNNLKENATIKDYRYLFL